MVERKRVARKLSVEEYEKEERDQVVEEEKHADDEESDKEAC